MTLFFASCLCYPWKQAGKHRYDCPMDSSCHFCGQKHFLCRMMGKCAKIKKENPTIISCDELREKIRGQLSNRLKDILKKFNLLTNMGHVNDSLQEKIDALKASFKAKFAKPPLDPDNLKSAEEILRQLQRIYETQKAAFEKKLKEDEKAEQAKCDAADFKPERMDD